MPRENWGSILRCCPSPCLVGSTEQVFCGQVALNRSYTAITQGSPPSKVQVQQDAHSPGRAHAGCLAPIPSPSQMICPMVAGQCTVHQDKGCCLWVVFRDALVQLCSAATSIPGHQLAACLPGGGCSWGRCSQCHALQRCACSLHPAKKWIS